MVRSTPVGLRLVVDRAARDLIEAQGGSVFIWPRAVGCCRGRTFLLESATERPEGEFELIHAADGFQVHAAPGLVAPSELHLELSRRGTLRAYWNGQGWIG